MKGISAVWKLHCVTHICLCVAVVGGWCDDLVVPGANANASAAPLNFVSQRTDVSARKGLRTLGVLTREAPAGSALGH